MSIWRFPLVRPSLVDLELPVPDRRAPSGGQARLIDVDRDVRARTVQRRQRQEARRFGQPTTIIFTSALLDPPCH